MTAEEKARNMLKGRTTAQLLDDWDETDRAPMTTDLATVRGWIMDELETRNPAAFDAWMGSASNNPRTWYAPEPVRIYSLRIRRLDHVSSLRVIAPSPEAAHEAAIAALFCVRFEIVDTFDLGENQQ